MIFDYRSLMKYMNEFHFIARFKIRTFREIFFSSKFAIAIFLRFLFLFFKIIKVNLFRDDKSILSFSLIVEVDSVFVDSIEIDSVFVDSIEVDFFEINSIDVIEEVLTMSSLIIVVDD